MDIFKSKIGFSYKSTILNKFLFLSGLFIALLFINSSVYAVDTASFGYKFCSAVSQLQGPVGKTLCTIAILIIGVSFLMGKIQTPTLITVILGIALIYSAPNIVTLISGTGVSGDCKDA